MSLIVAKLEDHFTAKSLRDDAYRLRNIDIDNFAIEKSEEEQLRSFEALVLTD
jgi:hypothetical protein